MNYISEKIISINSLLSLMDMSAKLQIFGNPDARSDGVYFYDSKSQIITTKEFIVYSG